MVEFRGARLWHRHLVDRRVDVRHDAAVYSGAVVNTLVPLASNDGVGNGSTVSVRVEAGRTYHVAVDGVEGMTGSIALGVTNFKLASFVSLVPARLLETRPGLSTVDGQFNGVGVRGAGSVTELVVAGRGGVAVDASAVVLTVTVTEPVGAGFVTVFPCGAPRPLASNVNFVAGRRWPIRWCRVLARVVGCVCSRRPRPTGRRCQRLLPGVCRRLRVVGAGAVVGDSRRAFDGGWAVQCGGCAWCGFGDGVGGWGSWWGAVDASAVVLKVTVTEPVGAGFVTVFPCGSPRPLASNVNFVAGQTVANSVVSGVGGVVGCGCSRRPRLSWSSMSTASSRRCGRRSCRWCRRGCWRRGRVGHGGWAVRWCWCSWCGFGDAVAGRGSWRDGGGCVGGGVDSDGDRAGGRRVCDGVPVWCAAAVGVECEFRGGSTVANSVVSGVGVGGRVCLFTSAQTQLVVDVNGFFA